MSFGVIPFDLSFPNTKGVPVGTDILFGYDTEGNVNSAFPISGIKSFFGGGNWLTMDNRPTSFPPSAHSLGSHSNVANEIDSATIGQLVRKGATQFEAWTPNFLTTETDPVFSSSPAGSITNTQKSNWDTAFGWGNHASAGYLSSFTEADPVFGASPAAGITETDIENWDTAFGWGNHASAGYLSSFTEADPVFGASPAAGISTGNIGTWNAKALEFASFGDHVVPIIRDGAPITSGILGIYTENPFDPETEPEEYESFVPEIIRHEFPATVKGSPAINDDEFVIKSQINHNLLLGLDGGKPAIGEDPAEYWHLKHEEYLKMIKLIANISANSVSQRGLTSIAVDQLSAESTGWKWIINDIEYTVTSETNTTIESPSTYPRPDFFIGLNDGTIDYRPGVIDEFGNPTLPEFSANEVILDVVIRDPDGNNSIIPPDEYFQEPFPNYLFQTAVQANTTGLYAKVWSATLVENATYGLQLSYMMPSADWDSEAKGRTGILNMTIFCLGGIPITEIQLETQDGNSVGGDWAVVRDGDQVSLYHRSGSYWMRCYYRAVLLAGGASKNQIFNRQIYEALPSGDQVFHSSVFSVNSQLFGGEYRFSNSTSSANPGSGKLAFNHATIASATQLYINKLTIGGLDNTNGLKSLQEGDTFYGQNKDDAGNYVRLKVTGAVTDNTDWFVIPIEYVTGDGAIPANNERVVVSFNLGAGGAGGGVRSVTGDGVDNADPDNPVLSFPTPAEIGAQDDLGTDINAALVGANVPSGSNVFATMADVGGGGADANAVHYNAADGKSSSEKAQARDNIGSSAGIAQLITTTGTINNQARTTNYIKFTGGSAVSLTGVVAGEDGEEIAIVNFTGSNLSILGESASSTAANRFKNPVVLAFGQIAIFKYNTSDNRWYFIGGFFYGVSNGLRMNTNVGFGFDALSNAKVRSRSETSDNTTSALFLENSAGTRLGSMAGSGLLDIPGIAVFGGPTSAPVSTYSLFVYAKGNTSSQGTIYLNNQSGSLLTVWDGAGDQRSVGGATFGVQRVPTGRVEIRGKGTSTLVSLMIEDSAGTVNWRFRDNGTLQQRLKSTAFDEVIRRDEQLLLYPTTVTTSGTINDQAETAGIFNYYFTAATQINGFATGENGKVKVLHNNNTVDCILGHENTGSIAANRINLISGADLTIPAGGVVELIYSTTNNRWKLKSKNF